MREPRATVNSHTERLRRKLERVQPKRQEPCLKPGRAGHETIAT